MREATVASGSVIGTAVLAIVLAALGAWAGAAGGAASAPLPTGSPGAPSPAVASLSLGSRAPGSLDFVPLPPSAPTRKGPARLPPRSGPFLLIAALPGPGTYILSVQLVADLLDPLTGAGMAAADVRYAVQPVGSSPPEGCQRTAWRPIGNGSRVAVLHGPGVCRLRVHLRWSWGATAAPGHYRGALRWNLSGTTP